MPSPNGLFYAESVSIRPGERVLDVGTGSGVLAIMAALRGARVEATDTDRRAIQAAEKNAQLNGVSVDFHLGALFAGITGAFDAILANLPNEIVAPAHLAKLGEAEARVFAGGERGNEVILSLIAEAARHMHASSRVYLPVHTLTDHHATLRAALRGFTARLVSLSPLPVKPFVTEHLAFYRKLDEEGVIHIYREGDRWFSYGYVYELTKAA